MHLEHVDEHAAGGRELLVTDMALEMLGFLVLDQDLLVLELALAVETPHLGRFLLLLPHRATLSLILLPVDQGLPACLLL